MKKLLFVGLIFVMGCGTVGYTVSKRTGEQDFTGEVYWKVIEFSFNEIWLKEVDSSGREIQVEIRKDPWGDLLK